MAQHYTAYAAQPAAYGFEHYSPQTPGAGYYPSPSARRFSVFPGTSPSPRGSPKTHTRRASQFEPSAAHFSARIPSARQYSSQYTTPLRNSENVSGFDYYPSGKAYPSRPRGPTAPPHRSSKYSYYHEQDSGRQSSRRYADGVHVVVDEDDYYTREYYDVPPPYEKTAHYEFYRGWAGTDPRFYYDQVPIYTETAKEQAMPKANQSRTRRASASYDTRRPQPMPAKPKPAPAKEKPASRKATDADAQRAGIPAGYSYKNWDPNEEPITLLGSVFDANSLGKWIYDWTVFSHGPAHPISDIAGDLWVLLIQLAGKVKRADETIDRIRQEDSRELVEDFLESGERLWVRFKKLLKICEEYMWKAAKRETGDKKPTSMGRNSGVEFVDSIFGRDRELEKTEKLMSAIRLWSMRFDANCDDILRNPGA